MRTSSLLLVLCLLSACHTVELPTLSAPAAPGQLLATSGPGFIRLVWSDQSQNEDQFVIGRVELARATDAFEAASLVELAHTTADQTVFRDPLEAGRFYAYGVAAVNAAGRSEWTLQPAPGRAVISTSTGAPCQVSVPSVDDVDGDGLPDETETLGWTVRVDQNGMGQFAEREIQSAPGIGDADGDELCDAEERILRTDPNKSDTDGDGLSDAEEVVVYGSSPINVDSDGDGLGNAAFLDGAELSRYGTSPTLADTDGDGRTDFEELNQNSTNPLLAELPAPQLQLVGTVDLSLDVRLSNGTLQTNALTQNLTRGSEQATNQTSSTATTVSSETSIEASATLSAGFPDGVSASVSAAYGQTDGYMKETSTSFEQSSAQSAQEGYQSASSKEISQQQTIESGKLAVQFMITNAGTRTFELQNLVVTALARDRENPSSFASLANLEMPAAAASVTLGENQAAGPFRVEATISANKALDLLSNPSGIYFRPASFQLIDRSGQNFAFSVGETTSNRTALLVIDFGGERPLETYRVATNVARAAGGQVAGVKMSKVLRDIVGLSPGAGYLTARNQAGVSKLTQVRDVAVRQRGTGTSKFWAVIAAENATSAIPVSERLLDPQKDFDELVLMPRDRIYLAYEADEDGDGIYAREERLYRTSDTNSDTDGDGLSDQVEIREGWNVFSSMPYYTNRPRVFSDPTRADGDGDRLDDAQERALGTDPGRMDTDGDGRADDVDPAPLAGINAPYAHGFGTVDSESLADLQVDSQGNVHLLGWGSGDFDADAYLGEAQMIFSADRAGVRRWATDLEFLTSTTLRQDSLYFDPATDHLFLLQNLYAATSAHPAAFPGVTSDGLQLVELDPNGATVGVTPLAGVTGFLPRLLRRLPGGGFLTVGLQTGLGSTRAITFDASGTVLGTQVFGPFPATSQEVAATNSRGIALIKGCQVWLFDVALAVQTVHDLCASMTEIRALEWLESGEFIVSNDSGAVSLLSGQAAVIWTNNPPPSSILLRELTVDSSGRTFAATHRSSGGEVVRQISNGGTLDLQVVLPAGFVTSALRVDPNGNLYVGGTTPDGLDGTIPAYGGQDIAVIRNPQLLYQ